MTDTTIQIGLMTNDLAKTTAFANAISGSGMGAPESDTAKVNAAVVDHINESGGIAGREVEPIYHFMDNTQYANRSTRQAEQQKACTAWTEDNHVFAIYLTDGSHEDLWLECAARTKTVLGVALLYAYPSQRQFEAMSDYWFTPIGFVADRRERAMAEFIGERTLVPGEAKVAIMTQDSPGIREGVDKALKPALAAQGITPELEIVYPDFFESPWQNYVLQLQSAGITHVVFSATTGLMWPTLFMMRAAENQRYHPTWLAASDHAPVLSVSLGAPEDQLANLTGMGWLPAGDTTTAPAQSPAAEECSKAMAKGGQPPTADGGVCEGLFFIREAFERAEEVSPRGFAEGIERLGTDYQSVVTQGGATRFGPRRHDGASVARQFVWSSDCACLEYIGPQTSLP